jgi:hypothetical protein
VGWQVWYSSVPWEAGDAVSTLATDAVPVDADEWVGTTVTLPDDAVVAQIGYRITATDGTTPEVRTSQWSAQVTSEAHTARTRFVGTITDLSSQVAGPLLQTQVQCIGMLAKFGERYIGDAPFPVETDAARAARIAGLVGGDFLPNGSTKVTLIPRDVDRRKAVDVLRDQAGSTGALLWEAPDGTVHYDASEARALGESTPPRLAGSEIIIDAEWRQEMSRFIPRVLVEYGVDPGEGAEKPIYATGVGTETKINTELNDAASAKLVGDLIVRRWGNPRIWDAPRVHTTTEILTTGGYEALLALEPGDVLETELMASTPEVSGPTGRWFVEGWTETWDRRGDGQPLVHEISLSVSDYQRFTLEGEDPGLRIEAPATWIFDSPPVTVTAVVDSTINEGTITLFMDGREIGKPTKPVGGRVSWQVNTGQTPVGTRPLDARFSGVFAYWKADQAFKDVTVTPKVGANVAFTVTPTTVRNGSVATLAASVVNTAGKPAAGRVTWQYSANGGASWTDWYTDRLVSGRVSRAWTGNGPDYSWQWRARYLPDANQGLEASTSVAVPVDVQKQLTQTRTYVSTWTGAYQGNGARRTGVVSLFQGRNPSAVSLGDQRSLSGFTIDPATWVGWSITKVEYWVYWQKWASGTGTARIGSHTYTGAPASNPAVTVRQNVPNTAIGGRWVNITSWGKGFATGSLKGISLGPAGSTNPVYYGEAWGHGATYKPQIRITGTRWV